MVLKEGGDIRVQRSEGNKKVQRLRSGIKKSYRRQT
jgi:hypothetical protein